MIQIRFCCSSTSCAADTAARVSDQLSATDALDMTFKDQNTMFLWRWLGSAAEEPFDQRLAFACVFAYPGMNAETAKQLNLTDGATVTVTQGAGSATSTLCVDASVPNGAVRVPLATEVSAQLGAATDPITVAKVDRA